MNTWEYSEVVVNAPSLEAQVFLFNLVKGSAYFIHHGVEERTGSIDREEVKDIIAKLGRAGWEMIASTEALQPNGWIKTRWVFKRLIE